MGGKLLQERYHYEIKAFRAAEVSSNTESIEHVFQAFQNSPRRSRQKHASNLHLKSSTVCCILHEDLNYHPYKNSDRASGLKFNRYMLQAIEEKQLAMRYISFTDKVHFYLHGHVSGGKYRRK